nr:slit homolog 2 protein [Leptinotarsa decemlineata]
MYGEMFFLLLLLYNSEEKPERINCPEYCVCDLFENLRRATCQYKKLYSIEINVPSRVQILDLSHNHISELGMNIFLELKLSELKLLNLSSNKINQIHLYGFEGLDKLKSLDLSFNIVQYFNEQWFISLKSLEELYLRGNNLQSINSEPKINMKHLKILDISSSKIENLQSGVLAYIPNLEFLDISNNFLVHLDSDVISSLPKLKTFIAEGNSFYCEEAAIEKLKNYTFENGITYRDSCRVIDTTNEKIEKFQRMVSLDNSIPGKNEWIYDDDSDTQTENSIVQQCPEGRLEATEEVIKTTLIKIITFYPSVILVSIFMSGLVIGKYPDISLYLQVKYNQLPQKLYS